jgi:CHAT domain-containing protein
VALAANLTKKAASGGRLLAVGNPQSGLPGARVDVALLFTDLLVRDISQRLDDGPPLTGAAATIAAVAAALAVPPAHLLFGCHGSFKVADPLESELKLADGPLTLRQLIGGLRLDGVELAVLCACQSALADFGRLPDEAVGLPGGLLQAGAAAVVGTLWPVDALPTVLLLRRFYDFLLAGQAGAVALRRAVAWLRDLSQSEFQAEVTTLWASAGSLTAFYLDQYRYNHLQDLPFAYPLYWAAFTYTGLATPEV